MNEPPHELETGRRERVYAFLDKLGIDYEVAEHPAIFTAAESVPHEARIDAAIFKHLFLRNKEKSRYYVYSLPIMKRANLAALASRVGEKRFAFASESELWDKLRIGYGSVSPLNVLEAPGTEVEILIDGEIFNRGRLGVHPNDNTATVILSPKDLLRVLDAAACRYRIVEMGGHEAGRKETVPGGGKP